MKFALSFVVALALASPVTAAQPNAARDQDQRIDLIQALRVVDQAENKLEQARLRYSAARSGQQNKGSGLISFTNPGSRKRWQGAVEETTAERIVAEQKLAEANVAYDAVRAAVCTSEATIPECRPTSGR